MRLQYKNLNGKSLEFSFIQTAIKNEKSFDLSLGKSKGSKYNSYIAFIQGTDYILRSKYL